MMGVNETWIEDHAGGIHDLIGLHIIQFPDRSDDTILNQHGDVFQHFLTVITGYQPTNIFYHHTMIHRIYPFPFFFYAAPGLTFLIILRSEMQQTGY